MANFTAKDVNELRKSTGVGMMDCKKALTEADGDVEKAIELLREKGLATQAKKAGRVAAEGMVVAKVNADNSVGCVVEVNSETDFVANTDEFKAFVNQVADTIIEKNPADVEALKATTVSGGTMTVDEALQELFLKIRDFLFPNQIPLFPNRTVLYILFIINVFLKNRIYKMQTSKLFFIIRQIPIYLFSTVLRCCAPRQILKSFFHVYFDHFIVNKRHRIHMRVVRICCKILRMCTSYFFKNKYHRSCNKQFPHICPVKYYTFPQPPFQINHF